MRKYISLVFFSMASVVILLQLGISFIAISNEQSHNQLLHTVTSQTKKIITPKTTNPKIDFKKMAEDMSHEKY